MKVLVIGANGKIGRMLVDLLHQSKEHTVKAMVRKEEQVEQFAAKGIETVKADLLGTVDEIAQAMEGCDAVVFTAGSGGHTGADLTLLVDLDGAVKSIEAAEKAGVNRFIMVSALQAHNRENWNAKIKHYYAAKHYADRVLLDSSLNYTIVRPGALLNEPGTGKVNVKENLERASIPRKDVAHVIFHSIANEKTFKRAFDVTSGETPITEALEKL